MSKESAITVTVLGKTIKLQCDRQAEAHLKEAASQLNQRLKNVKGKAQQRDDVLAVAALNLMHDVIELQRSLDEKEQAFSEELRQLLERVEAAE